MPTGPTPAVVDTQIATGLLYTAPQHNSYTCMEADSAGYRPIDLLGLCAFYTEIPSYAIHFL